MKAKTLSALLLLFAALVACGGSTKPPEYDDVNGTFEGPFKGADGIVTLQGTATFVITQTDGDLSANLTANGTITLRGDISLPMSETYKVPGMIEKGRDPWVNFTLPKGQDCPDLSQIKLIGKHNSEMRKLELIGVFSISDSCLSQVPVTVTVTKK